MPLPDPCSFVGSLHNAPPSPAGYLPASDPRARLVSPPSGSVTPFPPAALAYCSLTTLYCTPLSTAAARPHCCKPFRPPTPTNVHVRNDLRIILISCDLAPARRPTREAASRLGGASRMKAGMPRIAYGRAPIHYWRAVLPDAGAMDLLMLYESAVWVRGSDSRASRRADRHAPNDANAFSSPPS